MEITKSIKELRNKYRQRPVAILGGGPNLPGDLEKIPGNSILIGINFHASRLVTVDYTVFCDNPARNVELLEHSLSHVGRRISIIDGFSDWSLSGVEYWYGGMSATFATWFACYMGGAPVLLCGMDCYQSEKKYFYEREAGNHPCLSYPLENHLQAWRPALVRCRHSESIKVVSGPLVEMFGEYRG